MRDLNLPHGLMDAVIDCVEQSPDGQTEYELMQRLDKQYPERFPKPDLTDPMLLFQHHFILMHVLYRLQQQWWQQGKGLLAIHTLQIKLRPFIERGEQQLSVDRSLRDYYLDWNNLSQQSTEGVEELLASFWKQLLRPVQQPEALAELGLPKNANRTEIKRRYRQLVQLHHPDKGGDREDFERIRHAYERLRGE